MKKLIIASAVALSSLIVMSSASAQILATLSINCPVTSGDPVNQLRNFANSFIAGNALETIAIGSGAPTSNTVAFRSVGPLPAGVPGDLSTYSSASATFDNSDPGNPSVVCNYTSSNPAFPAFNVNYALLNAFGADVSSTTASSVTLLVPVGLKA